MIIFPIAMYTQRTSANKAIKGLQISKNDITVEPLEIVSLFIISLHRLPVTSNVRAYMWKSVAAS